MKTREINTHISTSIPVMLLSCDIYISLVHPLQPPSDILPSQGMRRLLHITMHDIKSNTPLHAIETPKLAVSEWQCLVPDYLSAISPFSTEIPTFPISQWQCLVPDYLSGISPFKLLILTVINCASALMRAQSVCEDERIADFNSKTHQHSLISLYVGLILCNHRMEIQ